MTQQLPCEFTAARGQRRLSFEELSEVFREAEKPPERWRVGIEAEKFGIQRTTGRPLRYDDGYERGVCSLFDRLAANNGWYAESEFDGGPVIALRRGGAAITLEPGSQLELSGAPTDNVHDAVAEFHDHLRELEAPSESLGLAWLGVGFHPLAAQQDLDWVPKQRYAIMRDYLPGRGAGALDMMRRTATVQVNLDFGSEEDAMRKVRMLLRLTPVFQAMAANAPLLEGRTVPAKSLRQQVWHRMDPARSGLIGGLWGPTLPSYRDYVDWALDAGMFLFKREGRPVLNTGQTFRSFLKDGFEGHQASMDDWRLHLGTLFPEVRLKSTIEVRCCDALPRDLTGAVPALFAGLLYDTKALDAAEELAFSIDLEAAQASLEMVALLGLEARLAGRHIRELGEALLDIASGGLARRGRFDANGQDESTYLRALQELVARGYSPADRLRDSLAGQPLTTSSIISACEI